MTKSQNTKDEQQKDLCITSEQLTEKWKKGELPEETECYVRVNGDIYLGSIQYKNGRHNKKLPYVKSFNGQFITKYVEEVLAPVPSYDELQNMNKAVNECMAANIKLVEQNKQLKGLLKELKRYFDADGRYYIDKRILLEINKVLGEQTDEPQS